MAKMTSGKAPATFQGKSTKLGGGGKFAAGVSKGVKAGESKKEMEAVLAIKGRAKYGKSAMSKMAAAGRKRAKKG